MGIQTTTTDKDKYIRSWNDHIEQLNGLSLPLINSSDDENDYWSELNNIQARLMEMVKIAADTDFES